jgi:hypothetical protein
MWHLNSPTEDTLTWYKGKFLDDIADSLIDAELNEDVLEVLMPGGGKDVIEKLLIARPQELYPLNIELEKKINEKDVAGESMEKIFKAFDYKGRISGDKEMAYDLAKRIGTRTCVYCNRIYSFTVETEDGATVARPDFDHWLPKDKHPLLSMSLYNLIPSCPICNRSIKLRNDFEYGKHVHPYQSDEERQFRFQYEPAPEGEWKLKLANCSFEEKETAKILKTEEVYRPYANSEVKDILDFAYKNTPEYLLDLRDKVMKAYGGSISKEHAYRMVFGTEMSASVYNDRPLSKMKRDVLMQLQEALDINLIDFE